MIDLPVDYRPTHALHPGRLLREELASRGISQREFAKQLDRPPQVVNQIVREKKSITPETALGIERVLGIDAQFWINLQGVHDLVVARIAEDEELVESQGKWLRRFPIRKMAELGWIEEESRPSAKLRQLLSFFAVPSLEALPPTTEAVGFRVTERAKVDEWALRAWLRQGERVARARETAPYDRKKFRSAVTEIRSLTSDDPQIFAARMKELCADAGVALVLVPHLPKTGASGVTRWLGSEKAMIQLNLRYKWADIFWFSFFHEAGHVLQHDTRRIFVDLQGDDRRNSAEDEADSFARESLIPSADWDVFVDDGDFSSRSILSFASEQGLHPGIIVGRLQREDFLLYSQRSELKQRLAFVPVAAEE